MPPKRRKLIAEADDPVPSPRSGSPKTEKKKKSSKKKKSKSGGREPELFTRLRNGRSQLGLLADEWIESFVRNAPDAMATLVHMVTTACNCPHRLDEQQIVELATDDALMELAAKFLPEASGDYPLGSRDKQWKPFVTRYSDFFRTLMSRARRGPLWDNNFTESFLAWMGAMTNTAVRSFRHTATVGVYAAIDGLASTLAEEKKALLYEEKVKHKKKTEAASKKVKHLNHFIKGLLEQVWITRARDSWVDLRVESMHAYSRWIELDPDTFIDTRLMKYPGWSLSDKEGDVRHAALLAAATAAAHDKTGKLEEFSDMFLPRILEMMQDVKCGVAVEAVKVLTVVYQHDEQGRLSGTDLEKVLTRVFDPRSSIRTEAARLFRIFLRGEVPLGSKPTEDQTRQVNRRRLQMVLWFMGCFDFSEVGTYIVDAMWNNAGFLHDWDNVMEELLDHVRGTTSQPLAQGEEPQQPADRLMLGLVRAMLMKLTGKLRIPAEREDGYRAAAQRASLSPEQRRDASRSLSEQLALAFPDLITKFQSDTVCVVWIAEIVQCMDLHVFEEKGLARNFKKILQQLRDNFFKFDKDEVLQDIAKAWGRLVTEEHPRKDEAAAAFSELVQHAEKQLRDAREGKVGAPKKSTRRQSSQSSGDESDTSSGYSHGLVWRRIASIAAYTPSHIASDYLTPSTNALTLDSPSMVLAPAAQTAMVCVLWHAKTLIVAGDSRNKDAVRGFKDDVDTLTRRLMEVLASGRVEAPVKMRIIQSTCDLLAFLKGVPLVDLRRDILKEEQDTLALGMEEVLDNESPEHGYKSPLEKTQCRNNLCRMVVGVCRVVDPYTQACVRILCRYVQHDRVFLGIIRQQRTTKWRKVDPQRAWDMEFEALKLLFGLFLEAHGADEVHALQNFRDLAERFALEHLTHFQAYQTVFKGSVDKLIRSGIEYATDDFTERYKFFVGLTAFAHKLLQNEARGIVRDLQPYLEILKGRDDVGPDMIAEVMKFYFAAQKAAGMIRKDIVGAKVGKEVDRVKRKRKVADYVADLDDTSPIPVLKRQKLSPSKPTTPDEVRRLSYDDDDDDDRAPVPKRKEPLESSGAESDDEPSASQSVSLSLSRRRRRKASPEPVRSALLDSDEDLSQDIIKPRRQSTRARLGP